MTQIEELSKHLEDNLHTLLTEVRKELELTDKKNTEIAELKKETEGIKERSAKTIQERDKLSAELSAIQEQLGRVSSLYDKTQKETKETRNLADLLSIYITLLEEVFDGRPHAKILYLVHGDKELWTREELNKSTGFEPTAILHAIHELNAAELINYNDESREVSIAKRIY